MYTIYDTYCYHHFGNLIVEMFVREFVTLMRYLHEVVDEYFSSGRHHYIRQKKITQVGINNLPNDTVTHIDHHLLL